MKIAVLSDIHGNLEALKNVMYFLKADKVEEKYFLGDAVGYLPNALEVIDMLQMENFKCIKGNHEAMLLGEIPIAKNNADVYKLSAVQNRISSSQVNFIKGWNTEMEFTINNRHFYLTHGSPLNNLTGYVYPDSDLAGLTGNDYDVIIMGHTHWPFIRSNSGKMFINVGSVGLPRDVGNLSSFLIYDSTMNNFEIYRLSFDRSIYTDATNIHRATKNCLLRTAESYVGKKINL